LGHQSRFDVPPAVGWNGHFASVVIWFSPLVAGTRLQGKQVLTTVRDATGRPAPDLVECQLEAAGPGRLWIADITSTWAS
jgi:hypothetical protein